MAELLVEAERHSRSPGALARGGGFATALSRLALVLFVVALPTLLVTSNIRILVSDVAFYRRGLREHGAEGRTGIPLVELNRAAREIIDYFENDEDVLRVIVTVDGQEQTLFNSRETQHLADVKDLIRVLFLVQEATLVYVITYVVAVFLWAQESSLRALAVRTLAGLAVGLVAVGIVAGFALAGFDDAWDRFHEIVFRNDLWKLDPDTDRLIQMFPEPFWQEATFVAALLTAAEAVALTVLATGYLAVARGRRAAPNAGREA